MSRSYDGQRPDTAQDGLRSLAHWLDAADQLIDRLAAATGKPRPNRGDDVQRDVRRLADWFEAHPDAAREAWAHVQAGDQP